MVKFQVVINNEVVDASSLKEAESRLKRIEQNDFFIAYIVRKEYSKNGKLLNEYFIL
jgi:hypothetical protein